jgi:hypothetical protein
MKLFVSILATIVLFLSTQCMISGSNLAMRGVSSCTKKAATCKKQAKQCCNKQKESNKEQKDCKDACNPFMSCCGCLYDGVIKNDFRISRPFNKSVKNGNREIFFKSDYISQSWQPPELVVC